ncbi:MAG: hypothetical protein KAH57_00820 [Thermoplasmata archaeon]|nr:hypothetical protein [Thermoplasmata archaeon]
MRVGNEGSVSPVGDLLAFGLSICIVLGLGSALAGELIGDERPVASLTGEELEIIRDWRGWEEDDDSIPEESLLISISSGDRPSAVLGLEGDIYVSITWESGDLSVWFQDGRLLGTDPIPEGTMMLHGLTVLIQTDEGPVPGYLEGGRS